MRETLQDGGFLPLKITFYLRAGSERLHMRVVNIVIGAEARPFLEIGPGGRGCSLRCHHFGIIRRAVLELSPFNMKPVLFRFLGELRFLEGGIQFG